MNHYTMKKHSQSYHRHIHTQKPPVSETPRAALAERSARRARKVLARLFPFIAHRLHRGVRLAGIHQHALTLSQPPPASDGSKTRKHAGTTKAA